MRAIGLWLIMMMNVMFFGMAGYMYLLWAQYWKYSGYRESSQPSSNYNVSRSFLPQIFKDGTETIQVRRGRPPLHPHSHAAEVGDSNNIVPMSFSPSNQQVERLYGTDSQKVNIRQQNENKKRRKKRRKLAYEEDDGDEMAEDYHEPPPPPSTTPMPLPQLRKLIAKHKTALTVNLRTFQMDGGNILFKHENRYGVQYPHESPVDPSRIRPFKEGDIYPQAPTREELMNALKGAEVRALRDGDEPFTSEGVAKYFPSTDILEGRHFNTCVVVSSAGSLRGSGLGSFIDSHDAVVRLNHAPVRGFKRDVGSKTTLRILNSQIVAKSEYKFWDSSLYKNVTLLVWDPCNYTTSLKEWYKRPDFDFFPEFFRRRLMMPQERLHLLHPGSLWNIWRVLQEFTHSRVQPNPPSSGFLGMVLMLSHCRVVHAVEFVPSLRLSKRCHYWEPGENSGCTFGDWHPLSTEKLLTMVLNVASDIDTYKKGYVTLPGFHSLRDG
ncbi:Glycosyl transferase family 29 [Trinorchestia longiramus]|nr:Glycosyl transferase family 29 [Trinorchestia longiramus]